ncbi:MAG: ribonuclease Z [Actinomycetia bacterium]|nr:ribonuclease Z [Actinomycetes bacterium]
MDLDVVFIGTSGSTPTARRGAPSLLIRRGGDRLLVDCGEGTQRQLQRSSIGLLDLPDIFVTHLHADHYLGLPGMLKTFSLRGREAPLTVYGPPGIRALFSALRQVFGKLSYELALVELEPGERIDRREYRLGTFAVDHDATAFGYTLVEGARPGRFDVEAARQLGVPEGPLWGALQRGAAVELDDGTTVLPEAVVGEARPGRRVVVTGDTRPARSVLEAAKGAQLLVHDGGFGDEEIDRANETGHSSATQAAQLACGADVGLLALNHISPRYFGPELAREARAIFANTVVPRDFDVVEVPFPERGTPRLIKRGAAVATGPSGGLEQPSAPAAGEE